MENMIENLIAQALEYKQSNNLINAVKCLDQALKLDTACYPALVNKGNILAVTGKAAQAVACFDSAIAINPGSAELFFNRGLAFANLGRDNEAQADFEHSIKLQPGFVTPLIGMGDLFAGNGKYTSAIEWYDRALALAPSDPDIINKLGNAYKNSGSIEKALDCYRRVLALSPDSPREHSNLLFTMHYSNKFSTETIYKDHLTWNEQHGTKTNQLLTSIEPGNRRIRIGYFSPDFRCHSVSYFIEPVLSKHDRDRFEVFCYSDTSQPDPVTERLQLLPEVWRDISGLSDDQAYARLRADELDILVDLAGHTAGNRMPLFARRLARVQITYLGYPNTTGLNTMDYRITDHVSDPPEYASDFYSEKLLYMPDSFLCYRAQEGLKELAQPAFEKNGYITFGTFNHRAKITDEMLDIWASIMIEVPASRLLLKTRAFADPVCRQYVEDRMSTFGISTDRLRLVPPRVAHVHHMQLYHSIDIALDTYPYTGTTTTCEALWMGAPVITLSGSSHVSRVGASILSAVGLTDLVAHDPVQYMEKAVSLARDPEKLGSLKRNLRNMIASSPLMDEQRFTRNLETCYLQLFPISPAIVE